MKTKYFISFIIISFVIIGSVILTDKVLAQETTGAANIQYPVKELDNCKDEAACKVYCDKSENMKACVDFAEKNNLMSQKEIEMAKKFIAAGSEGPGDCRGKDECETFCNNIVHIDECITFAEKNNLMPPEELGEAKKVQAAIKSGVKPPPCGNKKACDTYCDNPDHMEECITFGEAAGFIQGKELEDAKKMLVAVKKGVKPPPCRGKEACNEYCGNPDNMEMCMNFAIEAGFMGEQEKADSQKMLAALKKGVKPPPCQGKEACDVYCGQDEHFEECFQFAEAAGFMSSEEAAMARKTGGKGPGNCKGKDECESFCNNPDNQETCFNFAKENGMIPEADLKQMGEGKQKFQESLQQAPPAVLECLNSQLGTDMMEKFKSGAVMPPREIGDKMRECFEKTMGPAGPGGQGGPGAGGMMPPAGQAGPGGCQTPDECKAYCESHQEECKNLQPGPGVINPGGQIMPPQAGPGGCKTQEECQTYCSSHLEECRNLQQPSMPGGPGPSGPGGTEGPSGPGGQPGGEGFPPTGPGGCQSPEECQQMQNQMMPPGSLQPPINQQPPAGTFPPEFQQPPTNNIAPPPTETPPPPPPSSFLNPESLLGLILYIFTQTSHL